MHKKTILTVCLHLAKHTAEMAETTQTNTRQIRTKKILEISTAPNSTIPCQVLRSDR